MYQTLTPESRLKTEVPRGPRGSSISVYVGLSVDFLADTRSLFPPHRRSRSPGLQATGIRLAFSLEHNPAPAREIG